MGREARRNARARDASLTDRTYRTALLVGLRAIETEPALARDIEPYHAISEGRGDRQVQITTDEQAVAERIALEIGSTGAEVIVRSVALGLQRMAAAGDPEEFREVAHTADRTLGGAPKDRSFR